MTNSTKSNEFIVRGKWTIDGANTLSEAAQMMRDYALYLEDLENQGYQLSNKIDDDYGFVTKGGIPFGTCFEDEDYDDEEFELAPDYEALRELAE